MPVAKELEDGGHLVGLVAVAFDVLETEVVGPVLDLDAVRTARPEAAGDGRRSAGVRRQVLAGIFAGLNRGETSSNQSKVSMRREESSFGGGGGLMETEGDWTQSIDDRVEKTGDRYCTKKNLAEGGLRGRRGAAGRRRRRRAAT